MYDNTKGREATPSLELASTVKTRFEEFLRRQLGVSDANDPEAVVGALRRLYPSTAARLDEERQGVSIRFNAQPEAMMAAQAGASETPGSLKAREVRQALEADLEAIIEHPFNRDYRSALSGWRDAILAEFSEGEGAAALAADPSSRDRTFYSVRKLGDYARVSRMVGLVNPQVMPEFRRLAATVDEAAVVLRVQAGESLFRAGFDEGGSVFQVALNDLRQRREALIIALEELTASRREGFTENWGDSEASYGALLEELGKQGHQDLRALVRPETMARLLDILLDTRATQQPEYLRGIAATVPVELVQLKRLRGVATSVLQDMGGGTTTDKDETRSTASAPLSAFVQALNLFISAFAEPGTGSRLLSLSLPAPFASLELARSDEGGNVVRTLFHVRAELATEIDAAFADPDFDPLAWPLLIKLDRILYDVDRAIDLYLMGGGNNLDGPEERRAQIYAHLLARWVAHTQPTPPGNDWILSPPGSLSQQDERKQNLLQRFRLEVQALISELKKPAKPLTNGEVQQLLLEQQSLEKQWKELAVQLTQVATGRRGLLDVPGQLYVGPDEKAVKRFERVPGVPPSPRITNRLIAERQQELVKATSGTTGALQPLSELRDLLAEPVRDFPEIREQVKAIPEIKARVGQIPDIQARVDEIPDIQARVDEIPDIKAQVSEIAQLRESTKSALLLVQKLRSDLESERAARVALEKTVDNMKGKGSTVDEQQVGTPRRRVKGAARPDSRGAPPPPHGPTKPHH